MSKKAVRIVFVATVAVLLVLDLWLKGWVYANLCECCENHLYGGNIDLIPGVLGLTFHRNTGAFFGFLADWDGARWVLVTAKVLILGGLAWYYNRLPLKKNYWYMRVPLILVFAGGAGNLVDRFSLGYVRDMLRFLFTFPILGNFPVYNLADVYVTIGVFALVIVGLFVVKDFPFP